MIILMIMIIILIIIQHIIHMIILIIRQPAGHCPVPEPQVPADPAANDGRPPRPRKYITIIIIFIINLALLLLLLLIVSITPPQAAAQAGGGGRGGSGEIARSSFESSCFVFLIPDPESSNACMHTFPEKNGGFTD